MAVAIESVGSTREFLRKWWMAQLERHYLICVDVEQRRAEEAKAIAAHYQRKAALVRAAIVKTGAA